MGLARRATILLFSLGLSGIILLVLLMACHGLEGTSDANCLTFNTIKMSFIVSVPMIIASLIPDRFMKLSIFFRWISTPIIVFLMLASGNNTIQAIKRLISTGDYPFELNMMAVALIFSTTLLIVILWTEIKFLKNKFVIPKI